MGDELEEEFVNSWIRIEWFFGSGETWRKMPTWWSSLQCFGTPDTTESCVRDNRWKFSRCRGRESRFAAGTAAHRVSHLRRQMTVQSRGLQTETFVENGIKLSNRVRDLLDRLLNEAIT
jgi:hypothetical protein